jgi:PAS domain S-box-containing protein
MSISNNRALKDCIFLGLIVTLPRESTSNDKSAMRKKSRNATQETLHHLAFEHSLQPSIIFSVSDGKIFAVNTAACRLLGYSKQELIAKCTADIFDTNKSRFKKMLTERALKGESIGLIKALKKDGEIVPCEMTSAIFIDGGVEKAITTLVDLSNNIRKQKAIDTKKQKVVAANIVIAQTKSDVRLAENNEWIKYIAKTSYDVMWDWDIATGEIYVGDSIVEVFGYKVANNTVHFKDLRGCIEPREKVIIEKKLAEALSSGCKTWKDSFTFTRCDKSKAFTTCRASIVRDEDRNAVRMIGAIQDISKLQELENKLAAQKDIQKPVKPPFEVIWDLNTFTNELCIGEGFEQLLRYSSNDDFVNMIDWRKHLHPDDRTMVEEGLRKAIASSYSHWEHTYRLIRSDGSTVRVFNRASIFRRANGTAHRIVGVMHDIDPAEENNDSKAGSAEDRKVELIKKIKSIVFKFVHYSNEKLPTNFSAYLSTKLQYDYTYLGNVFSDVEGISIQQYVIKEKIERVKELLKANQLSLTEIAVKLQYSSVAHLSNQFRKVIGSTPTEYKKTERAYSN